jgi:hypothetical protein
LPPHQKHFQVEMKGSPLTLSPKFSFKRNKEFWCRYSGKTNFPYRKGIFVFAIKVIFRK